MFRNDKVRPTLSRCQSKSSSIFTITISIIISIILPITHAGHFSSHIRRAYILSEQSKSGNINSKASKDNEINLFDDSDSEDIGVNLSIQQRLGFDYERSCLEPLQVADKNYDSVLNVSEYVTFLKELSVELDLSELFIDVTNSTNLPIQFNVSLITLSCETCNNIYPGNPSQCCRQDNSLNLINIYQPTSDIRGQLRWWLYSICTKNIKLITEMAPSAMPSPAPSFTASQNPSVMRSLLPSPISSPVPSPAPSPIPTSDPAVVFITANTPFTLSNEDGNDAQAIKNNEETMQAIDDVFQQIVNIALEEVNSKLGRRLVLRGSDGRRKLAATIRMEETDTSNITDSACPSSEGNAENGSMLCQSVAAEIDVRVENLEPETAKKEIESAVQVSLLDNASLFAAIGHNLVPPPASQAPVRSPTLRGQPVPISNELGTIAGIACGAVALGLFAAAACFVSRRRENKHRNMTNEIENTFAKSNDFHDKRAGQVGRLGASANTGMKHTARVAAADFSSLSDVDDHDSLTTGTNELQKIPPMESSLDSSISLESSNAGSSGWSSSAGMSSLHTNSVDSVELGYRPTLKMMTQQSGCHSKYLDQDKGGQPYGIIDDEEGSKSSKSSKGSSVSNPNEDMLPSATDLNKIKLENAIKAEDWIAVGATAALLASSDTTSASASASNSQSTLTSVGTHSKSGGNSVDRARQAELDSLVAAGDWAGVIVAAAKYEVDSHGDSTNGSVSTGASSSEDGPAGEDSSYASANPSSVADTSGSFAYASASEGITPGSASSVNSGRSYATGSQSLGSHSGTSSRPSTGTGGGYDSPSKIQKRQEIRLEVEELVGRVVPEEADNVDEMMRQFRGREEELVETLRTMQERSIAQREREEMRRNAKREARRSVKKNAKGIQPVGGGELSKSLHGSRHGLGARSGLPPTGPRAFGKKNEPISPSSAGLGATAATIARRRQIVKVDTTTSSNSSVSEMSNNSRSNAVQVPQNNEQASNRNSPSIATADSSNISYNDRIELDRAIENGDWDALGMAAAKLGERSVSSAVVSDVGSLDSSTIFSDERESLASGSKVSSIVTRSDASSTHNQRAMELERLIQKGDWQSVVIAAGRFSAADRQSLTTEDGSPNTENSSTQDIPLRGASRESISSGGWKIPFFSSESKISQASETDAEHKPQKTSREEEDALAQAEMWMKIAKKSKNEGAKSAKGASNAADWAISRSLKALQNAEQQQATYKTIKTNDDSEANKNIISASSRRRNLRMKGGGARSIGSDAESF